MTSHFRNQQETGCCVAVPCCGSTDEYGGDWAGRRAQTLLDASTDAEIAREMNQLSVEEREKVYEDIHGVAAAKEETPEFLAKCIQALDKALAKIPKPKRRLLDRAVFLRPTLQTDENFKLMFLRADEYDATKAALHIVRFFEIKCQIFGEEKLVKDITLDDLGPNDVEIAVKSGCCLVLPQKDQTERPVVAFDISKYDFSRGTEILRFTWYLAYTAVEHDKLAQLRGVTTLSFSPLKRYKSVPMQVLMADMKKRKEMHASLPLRVTGYHYCTDDPKMQFMINAIRMTNSSHIRLRLRPHFGSELEMQYSLLTFGIHCKSFLTCGDGMTELHECYLQMRRDAEAKQRQSKVDQETKTGMVLYPEPKDVLIGRGRPYHEYVGSRALMELIDRDFVRYYAKGEEDRFNKTVINMEIVNQIIKDKGGRYLQRTKSGWKILDELAAREKTANLFRYRFNLATGKRHVPATMTTSLTKIVAASPESYFSAPPMTIGTKRRREEVFGNASGMDYSMVPSKMMTLVQF